MFKNIKAFSSFSVDDLEKAKEFCGQTLGLEISKSMGGLNLLIAGGKKIFVYSKTDHTPATFTSLNFPVGNVEQAVDKLTNLGVRFEIQNEGELKTDYKRIFHGGGPKITWFKDPAGNFLSVPEEG